MSSSNNRFGQVSESIANATAMEGTAGREHRIPTGKKATATSPSRTASSRSSAPTKFVLRSEKELEHSTQHRGRKMSRSSATMQSQENALATPTSSTLEDSSFGVQSLEEAIGSTFPSDDNLLSRTTSTSSAKSSTGAEHAGHVGHEGSMSIGKKRRAGNRVHPTIRSAGQRIISSDRTMQPCASPMSTSQSPFRHPTPRRGSNTSSTHTESQPLTPLRLSPHPESAAPSTPRSGSLKSFRLSDEESADETSSQAIMSSNGGDDEHPLGMPPQLVMPSLAVPLRRPFTEQGRRIGRFRVMILGKKGVGKTSFINSLYRCQHIVHMDGISNSLSYLSAHTTGSEQMSTDGFIEIQASTRPYPSWWRDSESRCKMRHRKSIGEGVLERNLTFVDTPGLDDDEQVHKVMNYVKTTLRRTTNLETMHESELLGLLSGDGGVQIDAVVHLFDATLSQSSNPNHMGISPAHQELLQYLSKWTNLIPVVSRSDTVAAEVLELRKTQISHMFELIGAEPDKLIETSSTLAKPFAVSFAPGKDTEIDASVLMSSQYLAPLMPSELNTLVQNLLSPDNIARMRHLSATKFLLWRQENSEHHLHLPKQALLQSPSLRSQSPGAVSSGSILDDSGKVLVPHSSLSYYRTASPAISDISGNQALAHLTQQAHPSEPFRQIRLAKWAQDLQRSLANERRKYARIYNIGRPSESDTDSDEKAVALARPGRGRLGGDLGVIDPRDPLGVLAFGRRGLFVLKIVGSCGLIGAVTYGVMRNWVDVQEFLGLQTTPPLLVAAAAVSPPNSGTRMPVIGWLDDKYLKGFFGWR